MKLISVDEIADKLKKSRRHTLDVIVKQPGFPKPIVPGHGALWSEDEVWNHFIKIRKAS